MGKPTILCVDDEMLVLTSLRDVLGQVFGDEYMVEIAESAEEALEVISALVQDQTDIPLIISDQLMPGVKGDELLAKIHANYPNTLKIMLSGQATSEAIGNAVNQARLFRYIAKPWNEALLISIVQEAIHSYFQDKGLSEVNAVLERLNAELEAKIVDRTAALNYRVELEQLIASISTEFINLDSSEIDTGIQLALQRLGEFVQADRSYLFQFSADGLTLSYTHEWCATDIPSQKGRVQNVSVNDFPWFMQFLRRFEEIYIPQVPDLPPEANAEKTELLVQQVQSLICVPIVLQKQLFGFVGLDSIRQPRTWSEEIRQSLRVVGEIFAGALYRQQTEAALRESEERFRRAFDDAPIGMCLTDIDGQFIRVNRALCEIIGYEEQELLERTFQDITHPDDLQPSLELSQQVLNRERRTYQLEKRYIHQQGHWVWASLNVSLVRNDTNQPLYFISQIQDIGDRREVERIKDEFISIVSHELRTPLTAIRGSLGILETGVLSQEPDTARRMLRVAIRNSDRLVRLVNDILDLERLESGKIQLTMAACKVPELMGQAVELVEAIAAQGAITLALIPYTAEVWVDTDAIIQTLTNLLSNAIKFSPPNSTVRLSADCVVDPQATGEDDRPFIRFSVQDQGRGIPAHKLDQIFGRFQQVDVSDSRQKGGTGLGLAICKSIVQQHGGRIWAESTLGQGSVFYFTLPLLDKDD